MSVPAEIQLVCEVLIEEMEVHKEAPLHQQSQQQTCMQQSHTTSAPYAYLSHPLTASREAGTLQRGQRDSQAVQQIMLLKHESATHS